MELLGGLIGILVGTIISTFSLIGIIKLLSSKEEKPIIKEEDNTPGH
jgi:hypothetical protein